MLKAFGGRTAWLLTTFLLASVSRMAAETNNTVCTLATATTVCAAGLSCLDPPLGDTYVPAGQQICRCPTEYMAGAPDCTTECPGGVANPCNGHGECRFEFATCNCDEGYVGLQGAGECSAACPRSTDGRACSGRGTCQATGFGTAQCLCGSGFRGSACELECKGGAARPCNGHGTCGGDGSCSCESGWRASDCSIECPGRIAYLGSVPCNGHGDCSDAGFCQCDERWRGLACDIMCPQSNGVTCGGHGICDPDGVCSCYQGYRGQNCGMRCKGTTQNPCSGHGVCNDQADCDCSPGWVGEACSIPCPGGEVNTCSGHGTCFQDGEYGRCLCDETPEQVISVYQGEACEVPVFNPAKLVTEDTLVKEDLVKEGAVWPIFVPSAVIFACIMGYILSRIYERWLDGVAAKQARIKASIEALQADDIGRMRRGGSAGPDEYTKQRRGSGGSADLIRRGSADGKRGSMDRGSVGSMSAQAVEPS